MATSCAEHYWRGTLHGHDLCSTFSLCDLEKYSDSDYFFSWSEKLNMLNSCNGLESEVLIVQKVSHPAVKNPIIFLLIKS
jgi:hypothetical protein